MQQVLILVLILKVDLVNSKSRADKSDIDKLKNVPSGFSSLESKVDKLNIGKLETTEVDLSKLSNVVKNDVVKKQYNSKIKNIEDKIPDITNVATKTTLNAKINAKEEILSINNLVTTAALNAKISEVKSKIPNITNLDITTALTAIENKVPNVSKLVTKKNLVQKYSTLDLNILLQLITIDS